MVIKGNLGGGVLQKGHKQNFCTLEGFISFQIEFNKKKNSKTCRKYIHSFHKLMFLWENPLLSNPTTNFPLLKCGYFFNLYFFSFLLQIILNLNIELYNCLFREVFPTRMRAKWMCLASKMNLEKRANRCQL